MNFSNGFSESQSIMTFNGSTGLDDSRLQLTNGYPFETGTAFVTKPLNIQAFTTDFLFQLSNPQADGITFMIQGYKPTAIGGTAGGLGASTIPNSLAIKFDFFNNGGEGPDSTGLYINGAMPTVPAINLKNTGINLLSGDSMAVHLTYDGSNLAMTITDQVTAATWSCVWQVNIPQIVRGNTAYVGFTGSTEIPTASQKIATWTYIATTPGQASSTATPLISPATGSYSNSQVVTITEATPGATIYYTTDGTTPTTSSTKYTGPITVSSTETLEAFAVATGDTNSAVASAAYTITCHAATPTFSLRRGTYTSAQTVTITDATPGRNHLLHDQRNHADHVLDRYTGAITVSSTETLEAIRGSHRRHQQRGRVRHLHHQPATCGHADLLARRRDLYLRAVGDHQRCHTRTQPSTTRPTEPRRPRPRPCTRARSRLARRRR